jgi:Bacterial sugar transferase
MLRITGRRRPDRGTIGRSPAHRDYRMSTYGFRGELSSVEKLQNRVDYDIYYIDQWTIWLDIRIIFKTILLVFRDSSAF